MTTVSFDLDTDVGAERILTALTDFSTRRIDLFPDLDRGFYRVHGQGDRWAEVTEGRSVAGGVWERSRYDWSEPDTVRTQLLDSNAFGPGSYWLYRVTPNARGGAHVHFELRRVPTSLKGRLLAALFSVAGKRVFRTDLEATLKRLRTAPELQHGSSL